MIETCNVVNIANKHYPEWKKPGAKDIYCMVQLIWSSRMSKNKCAYLTSTKFD